MAASPPCLIRVGKLGPVRPPVISSFRGVNRLAVRLLRQRRGVVALHRAVLPRQSSIVIAAGEDPDLIVKHLIDEPMLFVDSLGPASGKFVFQRLRLTNASEWIA